ncbi:unnamed protein product [Rotaria magnacalcarata]|uniref:Uncharacterized protein n=1 Tax=Rotaria magnacalcarata TaxID=392030 RepID=A0A816WC22_9BILA|nr:unnamed protein product [Rotaria magnacalcarata]CAF3885201.1 unnamed protein product [Rotaria magnacalcarata]
MEADEKFSGNTNEDLNELLKFDEATRLVSALLDSENEAYSLPLEGDWLTAQVSGRECFETYVPEEEYSPVQQSSPTAQRQHRSSLYTSRKYRIHFGTRPGSNSTGQLTYEECQ